MYIVLNCLVCFITVCYLLLYHVLHGVRFWICFCYCCKKVQVGNDQEKAQSEKDSHSKNRGGEKKQTNNKVLRP